jgi:uncharacterized protein YjiS (DUF1127 family)
MSCKPAPTFLFRKFMFFRGIATIAVAMRDKIAAAIERRRTRAALGKLDDYMLKDIGITRADIERISNRTYPPRQ